LIKSYCKLCEEIIIVGDLNAKTPVVGCRSLDSNRRILEEVLESDLDLCVLNEPNKPTYFSFNKNQNYSEILDLFLCSSSLANKMSSIEVLIDSKMESDHAPVMCTFSFSKPFLLEIADPDPRFNFTKADWKLYGNSLDTMIGKLNVGDSCEIGELNGLFARMIGSAADSAIPKFTNRELKSYPSSIVELIKRRRAKKELS
jgi:hypothetical protein